MPVVAACAALHRAGHRQEPGDQTRSGCRLVELSLLLAPARRALPTQAPCVAETWGSEDGGSIVILRHVQAAACPHTSRGQQPSRAPAGRGGCWLHPESGLAQSISLQLWPLSNLCFGP